MIFFQYIICFFSPNIRERLDPKQIEYFITWIMESNLLVSIPWGNKKLKLESGQSVSIPQQILQGKRSQIIYEYQQHCYSMKIKPMSSRTVYSILDSINANEQKFISGIDDFVKAASESWDLLKQIILQLPISSEDKKQFNILLEKNKLYLKSTYRHHCSENEQTTSHCTCYSLSQPNNSFYSHKCNHTHEMFCTGLR